MEKVGLSSIVIFLALSFAFSSWARTLLTLTFQLAFVYLSNWISLDKNRKNSSYKTSVLKDLQRANISALITRTEERRTKELDGDKSALDMTSRGVVGGVLGRGLWNRKQRLDSDPA